jgi:phospholipid/cholesterol/gamma-HCH transport system permease protein
MKIKFLDDLGHFFLFMKQVFRKPQSWKKFRELFVHEVNNLGLNSMLIITIISLFMGAVITIQTAYNITSPFIPLYAVGLASRDSIILEFSPTIISLILAGKVGSSIASEIGTMRVTEQIDALEIMGINSSGYLIAPKILAAVTMFPLLIVLSMFLGLFGGYVVGVAAGAVTPYEYIYGITYDFRPYNIVYALVKTYIFSFIITSVSAYHGYFTNGGALEVGRSSTKAVVYSSILILLFNVIITQILLS